MKWLCKIFGHKFDWYMCSGDDGEPSENRCERCKLQTVHIGLCRCLTPHCGCVEGLLDAVRKGRIPSTQLVRNSDWSEDEILYVKERVSAILERRGATQQEEEVDFLPVVYDINLCNTKDFYRSF